MRRNESAVSSSEEYTQHREHLSRISATASTIIIFLVFTLLPGTLLDRIAMLTANMALLFLGRLYAKRTASVSRRELLAHECRDAEISERRKHRWAHAALFMLAPWVMVWKGSQEPGAMLAATVLSALFAFFFIWSRLWVLPRLRRSRRVSPFGLHQI